MQVQRRWNNNNPNFEAKLTINDAGKCFSFFQKRKLTKLAKTIGSDSDRLFLGTRKYKTKGFDGWGDEITWQKKDLIILSLIDDSKKRIIIPDKTIRRLEEEQLNSTIGNKDKHTILHDYVTEIFNALSKLSTKNNKRSSKANIKELKSELKDFCNLKHTYHKETLAEKYQRFIKFLLPERTVSKKTPEAIPHEVTPKEPWEVRVEEWNRKSEEAKRQKEVWKVNRALERKTGY